jgi:hypothetical protein
MSAGEGRQGSGPTIDTPPPIADAGLRALYDYWRSLGHRAGGLPAIAQFDALHLPRLLPNIWLIEVEPETHRFRMRLAGENINAIYRRNIGRKYFAEIFEPRDLQAMVSRYRRALIDPAIFCAKGHVYAAAGHYCVGERLGLPMLGRDGGTRVLLGATCYGHRTDDHVALRPAGDEPSFHVVRAANHRAVEIVGL